MFNYKDVTPRRKITVKVKVMQAAAALLRDSNAMVVSDAAFNSAIIISGG